MSETALVGLIGGLGAALVALIGTLAGVFLQQRHTEKRWKHEEERWHAEPYRQRRFDALAQLHAALTDCLPSYVLAEMPDDWKKLLHQRHAALHRAAIFASLYVEEEDRKTTILDALQSFKELMPQVVAFMESPSNDTTAFDVPANKHLASYQKADVFLKGLLNPVALQKLAK